MSGVRFKILAFLLVSATALVAASGTLLPMLGGWLDVGQTPAHADYVMLLNGDRDTRPFKVADLVVQGFADHAIITSVLGPERLLEPRVHEVSRAILNRCGVPDSQIEFLDARVGTTFDEAKTLQTFMADHPDASFSVVTNSYHSRRSRWILGRVLGDQMNRVRVISAPTDFYDQTNWWKHEDGFVLYLSELLKASFYWVRYGRGLYWIAAVIVMLGLGWWLHRKRTPAVTPA